jgi:hypothetical protein
MGSILDWCMQEINDENHEQAVFDLEVLFRARCRAFLSDRVEHGFSPTTFSPTVTPSLALVETSDFGACARLSGGVPTIEITQGTLSCFLWAAMKCVMDPAFPYSGKEEKAPTAMRRPGRNTISLAAYDIPADPARRAVAVEIAFLCFVFVLSHEVGHLAQGHCALIGRAFHDYSEQASSLVGQGHDELDNAQRQALEFMADQFAARELLLYVRSVRDEVFTDGDAERELNVRGHAVWFCYGDPVFSPVLAYALLAIVFHFTSSTSARHPIADIRLLASMRACHQQIPMVLGIEMTRELFDIGTTLQQLVDDVLLAAAPAGETVLQGIRGLQPDTFGRVEVAIADLHKLRKQLEPMLARHVQGPKALLKYENSDTC